MVEVMKRLQVTHAQNQYFCISVLWQSKLTSEFELVHIGYYPLALACQLTNKHVLNVKLHERFAANSKLITQQHYSVSTIILPIVGGISNKVQGRLGPGPGRLGMADTADNDRCPAAEH